MASPKKNKKYRAALLYEAGASIPLGPANVKAYADADPRLRALAAVDLICVKSFSRPGAGLPAADLAALYVGAPNPQCLGELAPVLAACARLKKLRPSLPVVLYGPSIASIRPEELFAGRKADFALSGEPEAAFAALLTALILKTGLDKVPGLIFRRRGGLVKNAAALHREPDLPPSPYLDGTLEDFLGAHTRFWIEGSRGCSRSCRYCNMCAAGKTRFFPVERALKEMALIARRARGRVTISFTDNDFFEDKARARRLLRGFRALAARYPELCLAMSGNLQSLDAGLLRLLNLPRINAGFGIQSTDPKTLSLCGRAYDAGRLTAALARFRRLAPRALFSLDLISGLPGDDLRRFSETVDWAISTRARKININRLMLLPNSAIGAAGGGVIQAGKFYPYEVISAGSFTAADLRRAGALTARLAPALALAARDGRVSFLLTRLGDCLRGKARLPYILTGEAFSEFMLEDAAAGAGEAGALLAFAEAFLGKHGLRGRYPAFKKALLALRAV